MQCLKAQRFILALIFTWTTSGLAQTQSNILLDEIKPPQQSAEYIFRSSPKESLISVQLLGAVNKPGIYHVPINTDLLKVITLAGGTSASGDLCDVLVRKNDPLLWRHLESKNVEDHQGSYSINAEKFIIDGGAKKLSLHQDDFVYVPNKTHLVSAESSRNLTLFSVLIGIVLTGVLIDKNLNRE